MTTDERRAELLDAIARDERTLDRAVADFKGAVQRPFAIATRVRQRVGASPLPWMLGALLVGIWLGSRRRCGREEL